MKYFSVFIGLAIACFVFQFVSSNPDFLQAAEQSYLMFIAILACKLSDLWV